MALTGYRIVEKKGRYFPDWMNEFNGKSGAYIIRDRSSKRILYIGESHTGRLAATLKRHFWTWEDEPEREHFTFDPAAVEVAFYVTTRKAAKAIQDELIAHYLPRDNKAGIPADVLQDRSAVIPGLPF